MPNVYRGYVAKRKHTSKIKTESEWCFIEDLDLRSIEDQIKSDLITFLAADGTFTQVDVKKIYEVPRDVKYPLVTIQEIENSENTRYSTDEGEQVTNLSYQIDCYCKTTQLADGTFLSASDSAKLLGVKVSKLLGGSQYKLVRIGNAPMVSVNQDNTVIRYIQRFTGCLFKDTIYRR